MSLIVHIRKNYKNFNLEMDFETSGETMGILGPSGCGKSMTLQCIAGLITPDSGYIELNGRVLYDSARNVNLSPRQRRVGYLFQNYALFPNMTVSENILAGIHGTKADKRKMLDRMISMFHLQGMEHHYPCQLSGGQQQRTALARIFAYQPELLLLDEPFSALDTYLKEDLQTEMSDLLSKYHGESIFVTHNREEAYELCKKLLIMDQGTIVESGKTKEVYATPKKLQTARFLGIKNIAKARKINENHVEVIDWGITLTIKAPIPNEDFYIGIEAHKLKPCEEFGLGENRIPCKVVSIKETPSEYHVLAEIGTKLYASKLWWYVSKNHVTHDIFSDISKALTIEPKDILILEDSKL